MSPMLAFVAILAVGNAFPVDNLTVSNTTLEMLSNSSLPQATRDQIATSQILPHLRAYFNSSSHAIEVSVSDVSVSQSIPSQVVDDSCDHKVTAEDPKGTAKLMNDTHLSFGVSNISWKSIGVFADAKVDSKLDIDSDIKVELGKKIVGHCEHLGRKTVGVDVLSHGIVGLGLNFTASNAHVEKSPNSTGYDLVFNFECDSVALVLSWNVEEVKANNCKLKILDVEILSYCGLIEKAIKKGVNTLSQNAVKIVSPAIAKKVEIALNTLIGGVVRIPLKL